MLHIRDRESVSKRGVLHSR